MPPEVLGANGYWQDEDMDIDVRRKLIIGALDPRHDDVDQTSCPGIGQLGAKNRNPKCRSGFYVISYLFDMDRGIEILEMKGGPHRAASLPAVTAPSARDDPFAARPVQTAGDMRLVCPLFAAPR